MKTLSLVVPCFNEAPAIPHFYREMKNTFKQIHDYRPEYIFVDDGSTDGTLAAIKKLSEKHSQCHFISFSRNFGKEAAMLAGLKAATGDLVVTIDADCQHPPHLLPELLRQVESGYDCAAARRVTRKGESKFRSFCSHTFYKVINRISDVEMVGDACDYRLMTRPVVDALLACSEYNRYSKGLWSFVGYKTQWVEYENTQRVAGETKWSFISLFKYAIEGIVAFSTFPLTLISFAGLALGFAAFVMFIILLVQAFAPSLAVSQLLLLICVITFIGSLQLIAMGIIGEYLAKTQSESKHRPHYFIREQSPTLASNNTKEVIDV